MEFDWDDAKAESNYRKHRVSFESARAVFSDLRSIETFDPMSKEYGEDRFKIVGFAGNKLLAVVYTERNGRIRLISARAATKREYDDYARQNPQP